MTGEHNNHRNNHRAAGELSTSEAPMAVEYDPPLRIYEVRHQFTPRWPTRLIHMGGLALTHGACVLLGMVIVVLAL